MDKTFSEIKADSTLFIGRNCVHFDTLDSTNNYAARAIKESNMAEGTAILTRAQLKGKGQAMNKWYSEPGENLTFSLILEPKFLNSDEIFHLNILASIAIHKVLENLKIQATIKWPNDVLINKQKLAGILVEANWNKQKIKYAIVGVGLNVNQTDFAGLNATSIKAVLGKTTSLTDIFDSFCSYFESLYLQLKAGKRDLILSQYLEHLYAYKKPVMALYKKKEVSLEIVGLDKTGKLICYVNGEMMMLGNKEISFILHS
jgi:BirA family biotin operon repressor/biotin-[acetyl-CoA-carboxylase] ligase